MPAGHLRGGSHHHIFSAGAAPIGLKYTLLTKNWRFSAIQHDYEIGITDIFGKNAVEHSCKGNLLCRHNHVFWKLNMLAIEMPKAIKR